MDSIPDVFNLFWHADPFAPARPSPMPVALQHTNTLDTLPRKPARILFPALMTPTLHVKATNDGMIEVLIAAPKSPPLKAAHVNVHLKIVRGLPAKKMASRMPLFRNPKDKIVVEAVSPDGNGILKTKNLFKGILDARAKEHLPKEFDAFYAIQIHESCLEDLQTKGAEATVDEEDRAMQAMFQRLHGRAFRETDGIGTHEFALSGDGVDLTKTVAERPIVAYHPLYVWEEGSLAGELVVGHASDIHLNARQEILRRSNARVIDAPAGQSDSPDIGSLMNTCAGSFSSIMKKMTQADIVFIGGDLIDHIQNAFPFKKGAALEALQHPSAKTVWDLVDLENNYKTNYQDFVDLVSFQSVIRNFAEVQRCPVFAITGNHDCYEEAYGTSPRVLAKTQRANEGIPADNNLTFYEAMLVFGETWHVVRRQMTPPNFTPKLFEWFYTVLTPFSDFAVNLPKQRIVGLAWGEDEEIVSGPGSYGQGSTHLPRAEEAVTDGQLALFRGDLNADRKTMLLTHFTFVSYADIIPLESTPVQGSVDVGGTGVMRRGDPFGKHDLGTFEKNRDQLYTGVANSDVMSFVVTGHSHRKGLYMLGPRKGNQFATFMHDLRRPIDLIPSMTPIIVSDSAGPLPRLTLHNVAAEWGSDRPAGTLVHCGSDAKVTRVEAIQSTAHAAQPRLAVALDYTHIMKNAVFESIYVKPFDPKRATTVEHVINIEFKEHFPVALMRGGSLVLYGRPSLLAPTWARIPLAIMAANPDKKLLVEYAVPPQYLAVFYEWLVLGPAPGRFMSFGFARAEGIDQSYDMDSRWNFEVQTEPSKLNSVPWRDQRYDVRPYAQSWSRTPEAPNFDWRKQYAPYQ